MELVIFKGENDIEYALTQPLLYRDRDSDSNLGAVR